MTMWYLVSAITVVLVATHWMVYTLGVLNGQRREQKIQEKIQEHVFSRMISQQTQHSGTPEQERGSDDTG